MIPDCPSCAWSIVLNADYMLAMCISIRGAVLKADFTGFMGWWPLKYKTAYAYGTRERKSPMVRKSLASSTFGVQRTTKVTDTWMNTLCTAMSISAAIQEAL